jgi:hypothetical protein
LIDVAGIVMLLQPLVAMGNISLGEGRRTIRIGDLIEQEQDWMDAVKVLDPCHVVVTQTPVR